MLTRSDYGNGDFASYEYDRHGNLTRRFSETGDSDDYRYTYDSQHNLTSVSNPVSGATYFEYDFIGRPTGSRNASNADEIYEENKDAINNLLKQSNDFWGVK